MGWVGGNKMGCWKNVNRKQSFIHNSEIKITRGCYHVINLLWNFLSVARRNHNEKTLVGCALVEAKELLNWFPSINLQTPVKCVSFIFLYILTLRRCCLSTCTSFGFTVVDSAKCICHHCSVKIVVALGSKMINHEGFF